MQTFGVRVTTDFRKSKSGPWIGATQRTLLPTCMVGGLKPTSAPSALRKLATYSP